MYVHIGKDTVLRVHNVYRDEDRVVLKLGDSPTDVCLFLDAVELERLHDVVHEALGELGHSTPAQSTHEAYAAGWDAALSFVQTSTNEPVPTDTPAVPSGVG
jgi:hypothetical protein